MKKSYPQSKPFPSFGPKVIELKCLGICGKTFMSYGKSVNRLCQSCASRTDGFPSQGHVGRRVSKMAGA